MTCTAATWRPWGWKKNKCIIPICLSFVNITVNKYLVAKTEEINVRGQCWYKLNSHVPIAYTSAEAHAIISRQSKQFTSDA